MADQKITDLTADTAPLAGDMLPIVDIANSTTKKISIANLFVATIVKILAADDTGGTNVNTAQPWFPTAGGVTIEANTTYRIKGLLNLTRAAGVTSHTTGLLFGGTATIASILYHALCRTGDVATNIALNSTLIAVATNTTVKAASTSATENITVQIEGVVRFTTGGTFIPQFQYSAAPGGTPTIKANSFFEMIPVGDNNFATKGTWA